jgi:hypothetical protein
MPDRVLGLWGPNAWSTDVRRLLRTPLQPLETGRDPLVAGPDPDPDVNVRVFILLLRERAPEYNGRASCKEKRFDMFWWFVGKCLNLLKALYFFLCVRINKDFIQQIHSTDSTLYILILSTKKCHSICICFMWGGFLFQYPISLQIKSD